MVNNSLSKLLRSMQISNTRNKAEPTKSHQDEHTSSSPPPPPHTTSITNLPIEILQQIFFHLPCLTLLKCRCVSPLWNTCLPGNSHLLREALFLPSKTASIATAWPPLDLYFEIYTDATSARNRFDYPTTPSIATVKKVVLSHMSSTELELHPIVRQIDRYVVAGMPNLDEWERLLFTGLKNEAAEVLRPDDISSLKDMLVTMRPVAELHLNFYYVDSEFKFVSTRKNMRKCILFDREGVRLVDLLDVVEKQIAGLLRGETLRRIDEMVAGGKKMEELRKKVVGFASPVEVTPMDR